MKKTTYIRAGWLIDGSGGDIQERIVLTLRDNIIVNIEPMKNDTGLDDGCTTDLSNCTLFPPFIDSHVHLAMTGSLDEKVRQNQRQAGYDEIKATLARHVHYLLSHGVLAVRDGGDYRGYVFRYNNERSGGENNLVIIKSAGKAYHGIGRYGGLLGEAVFENETLADAFSRRGSSVDHVKLIQSGPNSLEEFAKETKPQFSVEEIRKLVLLAGKVGKKVMVHANGQEAVRIAIEAGCHSIEHGFFMGRDNVERMAEKQIHWVPTLFAMKACAENGKNQKQKDIAERTLQHQLEQIEMAKRFGVKIALGTDSGYGGVLHGEAVVYELKLLMKAGLSLSEAIKCATCNGAELLGIDEFGLIAKNRPAHFLVARGTPAMMPRKMSYLEWIYLGGKPCDEKLYRKMPHIGKNRKPFKKYI